MTEALTYSHQHTADEAEKRLLDLLSEAVRRADVKLAAIAQDAGMDEAGVSNALKGSANRHMRTRLAVVIGLHSDGELRRKIAAALIEPLGFAPAAIQPLTAERKVARLIEALSDFGPHGQRAIYDALKGDA